MATRVTRMNKAIQTLMAATATAAISRWNGLYRAARITEKSTRATTK